MSVMTPSQRLADSRWRKRRRTLLAQGRWEPFVDAEPVRERIRDINRAGMPTRVLSGQLGLPETALQHVMWRRQGEHSNLVRRETAEAVMAYWPTLGEIPGHSLVDSTGSRRRIQALITLGWTQRGLAQKAGIAERSLSRALLKERCTAELARRIVALYDKLWRLSPDPSEVSPEAAEWAVKYAKTSNFAGPLAWDDDTIDDPRAVPQTDAVQPVATVGENVAARWLMGEAVILDRAARREVLTHLFEWTNDTAEEIAARLEMSPDAASRAWERIKDKARTEGRILRRRVYVPRERNLTSNEMGAAA